MQGKKTLEKAVLIFSTPTLGWSGELVWGGGGGGGN